MDFFSVFPRDRREMENEVSEHIAKRYKSRLNLMLDYIAFLQQVVNSCFEWDKNLRNQMLAPITLVPFQAHEAVTLYNNYRLVIATSYRRSFNNMIVTMQNDCSKFSISHYILL